MPVIEQELNTPIVYEKHFGCSQRILKITYLKCNYFHQAAEQFVPSRRNPCGREQPGAGWEQRLHPPLPWRQLSPGDQLPERARGCSAPRNFSAEQLHLRSERPGQRRRAELGPGSHAASPPQALGRQHL